MGEKIPDGPLKPRVIASIGFELAQTDPAAALRLAQRLLSPADQTLLRASIRLTQAAARDGAPFNELDK